MKRTSLLCLLAAFLLVLASCNNGNKSGLAIPKDAAFVFHIDAASLSSKLTWEDIKKTTWYNDLREQAKGDDSLAQKILDNPEASGINVKSDFVFFIQKRGRGGYNVFEGGVKDAKAFEALVKKTSRQDKVEKDGEWNIITADNSTVVTWNDSKFAVINDMQMPDVNPMRTRRMNDDNRFGADSLKVFVKQVMSLDSDESLYDDDRFASVMKESGDMHFWVNVGSMYSDMGGMMSMMKISSIFEGNATAGTFSFDDGKISGKMKQYYGKEMQAAMDKWNFKKVDAAVLDRIPSENVIGVMAMNIDPMGIKEIFKTIGLDGMANMFLSEKGFTLDEVLGATKGEFVVAVSDLQMKDTTISFSYGEGQTYSNKISKPDVNVLVATSVNKKASFQKLLNIFNEDSTEKLPFTYQLNDEWFVAGNKPEAINAFVSGKTTKHVFTDKISGSYGGVYIDIQRLLNSNLSEKPAAKNMLAASAAVWKDLVAVTKEYKNGVATAEFTINMVDSKTNSLKQINQYIEKMNAINKEQRMAREKETDIFDDSLNSMVPPPPPPVVEQPKR